MNLEYVLKTILQKNTDSWSGKLQFVEKKEKEGVSQKPSEPVMINFQHYFTEAGLPMLSLLYTKNNMMMRAEYVIHFSMKLYDEMFKGLENTIRYLIAMGNRCSTMKVIEAHDNDAKKYAKQLEKQQVANRKRGK